MTLLLLIVCVLPTTVDGAACVVTNGSALNDAACTCGSEECTASTGLICFETVGGGSCRKSTVGPFGFQRPTTNVMCVSVSGRQYLDSVEKCEEAATSMGLSDTTAELTSGCAACMPPGCYFQASSLVFNPHLGSTKGCNGAEFCICVAASDCLITDGSQANAAPCKCGSEICLLETGLICFATVGGGSCRKNTPGAFGYPRALSGKCTDVSGRHYIKMPAACNTAATRLGLSDTTASVSSHNAYPYGCRTGGYSPYGLRFDSDADSNTDCSFEHDCICVAAADCTITDGTGINAAELCQCGTTMCTQDTGMICYSTMGGGSCRKTVWASFGYPEKTTSGDCQDEAGTVMIASKDGCIAAAVAMGLDDITADSGNSGTTTRGCYFKDGQLKFSTVTTSPSCTNTDGSAANTETCICGTSTSGSACTPESGLYCVSSSSTCSAGSECANDDGTAVNSVDCACGTAACNDASGMFCKAALNMCWSGSSCTIVDGSAANAVDVAGPCRCGEVSCSGERGLFCYADGNQCSTSVISVCAAQDGSVNSAVDCWCANEQCTADRGPICFSGVGPGSCRKNNFGAFGFPILKSGTCDAMIGHHDMTEREPNDPNREALCSAAGEAHGLSDTSASATNHNSRPKGCFYQGTGGTTLQLNLAVTNFQCGGSYTCICLVAADCSFSNSTTINPHMCTCGTKLCSSSGDGLFCYAAKSKCSAVSIPDCANTGGMAIHSATASCECGTTTCTPDTGLICFSTVGGGSCRKTDFGAYGYPMAIPSSGSEVCTDVSGRGLIDHGEDCDAAATSMDLSDTSSLSTTSTNYPTGCMLRPASNNLYIKTVASTASCTSALRCVCIAALDCVNTDGTAMNVAKPCKCGSVYCTAGSGFICVTNFGSGHCRKTTLGTFQYFKQLSGKCSDVSGRKSVVDAGACGLGAILLGMELDSPSIQSTTIDTPGCYLYSSVQSTAIWYNSRLDSLVSCDDGYNEYCVCLAAAACTDTTGLVTSNHMCTCGTTTCTATTGFFCYLANNECATSTQTDWVQPCASSDGSAASQSECACGTSICTASVGLHCILANNRCGCKPGMFRAAGDSSTCEICPSGQYTNQSMQTSCTNCGPGTWSTNDNVTPLAGCSPCSMGKYSTANALTSDNECTLCEAGRYSAATGLQALDECKICEGGKWSADEGSSSPCSNCLPGKFNGDKGETASKHNGALDCDECPPGMISEAGALFCYNCPVGTYTSTNVTQPCQFCPAGYKSEMIGEGFDANSTCSSCDEGYYQSDQGKPYCLPCIPGKHTALAASKICQDCDRNEYQNEIAAKNCVTCPTGRSSPKGSVGCSDCLAGKFVQRSGSEDICSPCNAGRFTNSSNAANCFGCPNGWGNTLQGSTGCNAVPPGSYITLNGAIDSCTLGHTCAGADALPIACSTGEYASARGSTSCVECAPGKYAAANGTDECTECENDKYQPDAGAAACIAVLPGYYRIGPTTQVHCSAGKFGLGGSTKCDDCSNGQFQDIPGRTSCKSCTGGAGNTGVGNTGCNAVPPGSYVTPSGGTKKCEVGHACPGGGQPKLACNPGYYAEAEGSISCIDCAPGKYAASHAASVCIPCDNNEYQPGANATSCITVQPGYYQSGATAEVICPAGKAGLGGNQSCSNCIVGQFQNVAGNSTCKLCPTGFGNDGEGSTGCVGIPPGSYEIGGVRKKCEKGYKCEGENKGRQRCERGSYASAPGSVACVTCPPGSAAPNLGSEVCDMCPQDTFNSAFNQTACMPCGTDATTKPGEIGATVCDKCDAGFFMDKTTTPKSCQTCSPGKVSQFGQSECTSCEAGFYSKLIDNSTCYSCDQGQYGDVSEQWMVDIACKQCKAGKYSSAKGVSSEAGCNDCSPGKYGNTSGAINGDQECHSCAKGQFQSTPGLSSCNSCPEGWGNSDRGSTGCNAVPPGSYSDRERATKICQRGFTCQGANSPKTPCATGTFTNNTGSVNCVPCAPGKYASKQASYFCEDCPTGWLQDLPQQPACKVVEPGKVVADGGGASIDVPLGSKIVCGTDAKGACSSFQPCAGGTYGETPPSQQCLNCPAGWTSTNGATTCAVCDKGKYSDQGGVPCKECLKGTFQPQNTDPSVACIGCPSGYFQDNEGAPFCISLNWPTASSCKSTEYLNTTSNVPARWKCDKCPRGGDCTGAITQMNIRPLFGWWRCPNAILNETVDGLFEECQGPACLGAPNKVLEGQYTTTVMNDKKEKKIIDVALRDQNESCAVELGYQALPNIRCSTCKLGYASSNDGTGRCSECNDEGGSLAFLVVVIVLTVLVFVLLVALKMKSTSNRKKAEHSTMKRSLLTHLQMIAIVMSLNVSWPGPVRIVLSFFSSLTSVSSHTASVQCSVQTPGDRYSDGELFYGALILSTLLPVAVMAVSYLYWFLLAPLHRCFSCGKQIVRASLCPQRNPFSSIPTDTHAPIPRSRNGTPLHSTRDGWLTTNLLLIYIVYPSIVRMSFQVLQWQEICGETFWSLDDTIRYNSDLHRGMILGVAMPALIIYGFLFPALGFMYIRSQKDRQSNEKLVFRFGLLYSGFAPKFYWWELVIFIRKLAIILISTFGRTNSQQLHIAMGVLVVLLYLQENLRPYEGAGSDRSAKTIASNKRLHLVESGSLLILILMVWCAVFFDVSECDEGGTKGFCNFFTGCLGIMVLFLNFCFALATILITLRGFGERNNLSVKFGRMGQLFRRTTSTATPNAAGLDIFAEETTNFTTVTNPMDGTSSGGGASGGGGASASGGSGSNGRLFAEEKVLDHELGTLTMKTNPLSKGRSRLQFARERVAKQPRKSIAKIIQAVEEDHALAVELTQMGGTGGGSEVGISVASSGGGGGDGGGGRTRAKTDKMKKKRKKSTTNPFITTAETQQIHVDPNSGRRYTYNPKTKQSVWLK